LCYTFSLAQETDAQVVFALYNAMIGTPGCTWSDDYPTADLVERDIQTGSLYILRDLQGNLIAAAAAGPDDELADMPWDMQNPCELARVAVTLPYQSRGVGSYLLQSVIADVKARGFDGIRMLVSINNPHALALYDKNGFTRLDKVHMYNYDFYRYQMVFPQ
jgi:ribosomal protein S18 acetylase RimI-like enzyme